MFQAHPVNLFTIRRRATSSDSTSPPFFCVVICLSSLLPGFTSKFAACCPRPRRDWPSWHLYIRVVNLPSLFSTSHQSTCFLNFNSFIYIHEPILQATLFRAAGPMRAKSSLAQYKQHQPHIFDCSHTPILPLRLPYNNSIASATDLFNVSLGSRLRHPPAAASLAGPTHEHLLLLRRHPRISTVSSHRASVRAPIESFCI